LREVHLLEVPDLPAADPPWAARTAGTASPAAPVSAGNRVHHPERQRALPSAKHAAVLLDPGFGPL